MCVVSRSSYYSYGFFLQGSYWFEIFGVCIAPKNAAVIDMRLNEGVVHFDEFMFSLEFRNSKFDFS